MNECVATGFTGALLMHMSPVTSNVPSTHSVSLAAAATSVVGNDVGGGVVVHAHESPVATNIPITTSVSLAAADWSLVHDDVCSGVVVAAYAVTKCVAGGVTGTPLMHMSPVTSSVPSTQSVSVAAAATSVVGNDVGGGVVVRAHEFPVATNIPITTTVSLAATFSAVVGDDVGGGVVVAANNVIKCLAIIVTGAASVHVFPVTGNVPSTESVSCASAATSVVHDDVGGGVIVGAHESPVATNT